MKDFVYRNPRPQLTIESNGGKSLGHCYTASYYRITSQRKLTRETIRKLFESGFLGSGQGFAVQSKCDGQEAPSGHDEIQCIVVDRRTGEQLNESAINPYSGELYKPIMAPYYVYDTETTCDSGD